MAELPPDMPQDMGSAFGQLMKVTDPTLADLKLMVFLEAAGQGFYESFAAAAPTPGIRDLLAKNGQEEMAHAHRVSRVIKIVHGQDFPVPSNADNPYCGTLSGVTLDEAMLQGLANSEFAGEPFYAAWAASQSDPEAARLLQQNGKEETRHGQRIGEALAQLRQSQQA